MIYVHGYLGAGALYLLVLLARRTWRDRHKISAAWTVLRAGQLRSLELRHLGLFLLSLLVGLAFVAAWPVVVAIQVVPLFKKEQRPAVPASRPAEQVFTVQPEALIEHLTIEAIEARELVLDPLDAVPALPFGHLHARWRQFREACHPDCEIWGFAQRWKPRWGAEEIRLGYAEVGADGAIRSYLVTAIEPADLMAGLETSSVAT